MATGTTGHHPNGPLSKRLAPETIHGVSNLPHMLDDGAVGILSRTIIPSTTVLWILPARIRHPERNDVVFVGQSFVQLREFLDTRYLAEVPGRLDLGCRILAANVLSYVDSTAFIDRVVKQEERQQNRSKPFLRQQMLVLTLDCCEIAFVYAEERGPNEIRFKLARKKLPADVSALGQYGKHLAVDFNSATIAVSPAYGHFGLIRVKTVPELRKEIANYDSSRPEAFAPLKEERFIQADGLILRMAFLHSPPEAQTKIVLALLVARDEATYVLLYTWEDKAPLRYAKLESSYRLKEENRMPLLLIPSNHNASFTLVTETGLLLYHDVLSSNLRSTRIEIPPGPPSRFFGSGRSPLWVQWAKPHRHSEYLKTNDDFFLVREDGNLEYFEITHEARNKLQVQFSVGSLDVRVDSAFTILQGPFDQGGDICVVAGDMTNGAVWHILPKLPMEQVQTLLNLAPVQDMLVLDPTGFAEDAHRIFVTSGQGEGHAAVTEIRHGLEARIGFFAEQEDSSIATGLWVLPEIISDHFTLLISYPSQTVSLRISFGNSTLEVADGELPDQGLQLGSQTLALSVIKDSLLVQITPSQVVILSLKTEMGPVYRRDTNCPLSIASVNPDEMLIATVTMMNDVFQILLSSIDGDDTSVRIADYSRAYSMREEPSSILIVALDGVQLLIIGTIVGSIQVLAIEPAEGLHLLSQYSIGSLFPHVEPSAICSLVLLTGTHIGLPALACGTRNGWLLGLTITKGLPMVRPLGNDSGNDLGNRMQSGLTDLPNFPILHPNSARRVGQTSVKLKPDPNNRYGALLFCDSELHRLSYSRPGATDTFQLSRIWFTDVARPEFRQPEICAVAALFTPLSYGFNPLEPTLICLSRSELYIASLSLEPSIVPRRMIVDGDPQKLLYARGLGRLVVAINQTKSIAGRAGERSPRRMTRAAVQFLDPDQHDLNPGREEVRLLNEEGSRITSLVSLAPTNGKETLEVIVAGLYLDRPDHAYCDGRIVYLTVIRNQQSYGLDVNINHTADFVGSPIYSLAQYGLSSLVVCAGTDVFLQTLDLQTKNLTRNASFSLPSPAVSLHVSGRFIFATTARHGLKVLEVQATELTLRAQETRVRETTTNSSQFLGTAEGGIMTITSNKGGRLLGLLEQDHGGFLLQFDASLPVVLNNLRGGSKDGSVNKPGTVYYGSTLNGTLYRFTVLSRKEWELLNFILRLAGKRHAPRHNAKHKSSRLKRKDLRKVRPSDMHVNGDDIAELSRYGPGELRHLLESLVHPDIPGQESSSPDEKFGELSVLGAQVFGKSDDPVFAAIQWMQKLVSTVE